MTAIPLSPYEIAEQIVLENEQITQIVEHLTEMAHASAVSEADYKFQFASARLKAWDDAAKRKDKITVGEAEDIATVATYTERQLFLHNMQILAATKEALKARMAKLNSLQTLASMTVRAGG